VTLRLVKGLYRAAVILDLEARTLLGLGAQASRPSPRAVRMLDGSGCTSTQEGNRRTAGKSPQVAYQAYRSELHLARIFDEDAPKLDRCLDRRPIARDRSWYALYPRATRTRRNVEQGPAQPGAGPPLVGMRQWSRPRLVGPALARFRGRIHRIPRDGTCSVLRGTRRAISGHFCHARLANSHGCDDRGKTGSELVSRSSRVPHELSELGLRLADGLRREARVGSCVQVRLARAACRRLSSVQSSQLWVLF